MYTPGFLASVYGGSERENLGHCEVTSELVISSEIGFMQHDVHHNDHSGTRRRSKQSKKMFFKKSEVSKFRMTRAQRLRF